MFLESTLRPASEAAEVWLRDIADACYFAEQGNVSLASALLFSVGVHWGEKHWSILEDAKDDLAAVSDGVIRLHGPCGRQCHASAHEAVLEIMLHIYVVFTCPLGAMTDTQKRADAAKRFFDLHSERLMVATSELPAHIRRERSKLLASTADRPSNGDGGSDPFLPAQAPTECAKVIKCHLTTLKRYIENGTVRCEKVGPRLWRLHREDVRKLGGQIE